MSSRFGASLSANAGRSKAMSSRVGQRVMSEKQIQAYLVSRDALRRIQRTSALLQSAVGPWRCSPHVPSTSVQEYKAVDRL